MEFWGVEVKKGTPLLVQPGEGMIIHMSQACLGELSDRLKESVSLIVKVDGQKLVLGTLISDRLPQQQFDLVFDREFELSHNWKNGSVYFYGYKTNNPYDGSEEDLGEDNDSLDIPLNVANNGKHGSRSEKEKPPAAVEAKVTSESAKAKQKVTIVEPQKDESSDDEDDDDSSDSFDKEPTAESDSSESGQSDSEESDDDDESEEEEDEETPPKIEPSKKRPADSTSKTPGSEKKTKFATPQKTEGKKNGGRVATPYPTTKQVGKAVAAANRNMKSAAAAGSHSCKPCNRSFNSEQALQSHTKAKHTSSASASASASSAK